MKIQSLLLLGCLTLGPFAMGVPNHEDSPEAGDKAPEAPAGPAKAGEKAPAAPAALECGDGVKKWARGLAEIAKKSAKENPRGGFLTEKGGLRDTKKFMSKEVFAILEKVPNKSSGDGKSKLLISGGAATFQVNGETWEVSESPWYHDQYPDGIPPEETSLVIRNQLGGGLGRDLKIKLNEFPLTRLIKNGKVQYDQLLELVKEANENSKKELSDPAKIAKYDLPKNERIGYIGLVPKESDVIIDGMREDVENLPRYLNCKGYQFVSNGPGATTPVNGDPSGLIRRMVKEYKEQGIKTVYLNLAAHGSQEGIHFPLGGGKTAVLKPEDLAKIFDDFPEMKFVLDTAACHAGGIPEMMTKYKDKSEIPRRIVAFVQTKMTGFNQEGRIFDGSNPPTIKSTYYNIFRIGALEDGKSFGEAHLLADKYSKNLIPSDAEAYVSGPSGGVATRNLK